MEKIKRKLSEESGGGYDTFSDNAMGFYHAVAWKHELWLQWIIVFHIVLLLLVVSTRKYINFQTFLFLLISGLVFASERLNTIGAERWKEFSTQNYFDPRGVFIGVVFSGPLLVIGFLQLILWLCTTSELLIKVKRKELEINQKGKNKKKTS